MKAVKSEPKVVGANTTMARAYLLMDKHKCFSLPVTLDDSIVGVIFLKDIQALVRNYVEGVPCSWPLKVGAFMQAPVKLVDGTHKLSDVIRALVSEKMQAVVVRDNNQDLGVISKDDLLEILAQMTENTKETVLDSLNTLATS